MSDSQLRPRYGDAGAAMAVPRRKKKSQTTLATAATRPPLCEREASSLAGRAPHISASPAGRANAAARGSTLDHCLVPWERVAGLDGGARVRSTPRESDARCTGLGTDSPETTRRQFGLTNLCCQSRLTVMNAEDIASAIASDDPAVGLRASLALHRLAERVEADHVRSAREKGWSWQQIGDALGITRQSVHTKYNKESS